MSHVGRLERLRVEIDAKRWAEGRQVLGAIRVGIAAGDTIECFELEEVARTL